MVLSEVGISFFIGADHSMVSVCLFGILSLWEEAVVVYFLDKSKHCSSTDVPIRILDNSLGIFLGYFFFSSGAFITLV